MSNKETHDLVTSPMSPSSCSRCLLTGAELDRNPCPSQPNPAETELSEILKTCVHEYIASTPDADQPNDDVDSILKDAALQRAKQKLRAWGLKQRLLDAQRITKHRETGLIVYMQPHGDWVQAMTLEEHIDALHALIDQASGEKPNE